MYRWLATNNIKSTDVDIVQLDAAALSQAFVQGDIDVMFAWEPYNYNAVSKIPALAKSWPTQIYNGRHTVVMNSDYTKAHPETVDRLNKGFLKAEAYIKENPEAAKKIVIERTGMSATALNALWSEYTYTVGLDDGFLGIIKDETGWIKLSEGNNSQADVLKLINPASLLRVDANNVGKAFKP
jgi:ABC-type nitrate/sulfonate/bicarbonate transport system substrate-binding protein